jgi:1-acyl-sn-glycerol-3-phosphate acyltransferase
MIKGLVNYLNKTISEQGITWATRDLIGKCNTKIIVKSNKEIDKLLKKAAGILVADHTTESDVAVILAAIKQRNDVYLIINSSIEKLIPGLSKHLIPVYVYSKAAKTLNGRIKLKILSWFHKFEIYSKDEEHRKNMDSIEKAVKKINEGALVIIFPNGGAKEKDWFNGVGNLIHGIKNKKESFIFRAYIKGTTNWDYLRFLPLLGKLLPKFEISFAKPLRIDTIKKENPEKTTKHLENKYWNWIGSVNLWTKLTKNYAWLKMLFIFLISKPY